EVEGRCQQEKVFAQAYTLFGVLALLVASVGLFGLMSYSVARRTNEIGVRMALGAQRQDVLRLVMRESMMLVVAGVAIGLGGAIAASRLIASLPFGLAPTDPTALSSRYPAVLPYVEGACMAQSRLAAIVVVVTVVGVPRSASVRAQEPSDFGGRWTLSRELSQIPREIGFGVDWMSTGGSGQDS